MQDVPSPLIEISSRTRLNEALSSPNAIIFAHVDWSTHSLLARKTLIEFSKQWSAIGDPPDIKFYCVDLTKAQQNIPVYIGEWLSSDPRLGGLPIRGTGDVVWLKNGDLQKLLPAFNASVDLLRTETQAIFHTEQI